VGDRGCTQGATLEKPCCFPKRRQLLPSPLSLPSPHSHHGGGGGVQQIGEQQVPLATFTGTRSGTSAMAESYFCPSSPTTLHSIRVSI